MLLNKARGTENATRPQTPDNVFTQDPLTLILLDRPVEKALMAVPFEEIDAEGKKS